MLVVLASSSPCSNWNDNSCANKEEEEEEGEDHHQKKVGHRPMEAGMEGRTHNNTREKGNGISGDSQDTVTGLGREHCHVVCSKCFGHAGQ